MIYLQLFLNFLKIGAVSFGGGYGMISLIRETVLGYGWLTEGELLNFIAVSESTPGPVAVNMATFVGASEAGVLGAFLATLGIVLPSFIVILVIAAVLKSVLKYAGVQAALGGIRPAIIGLILAAFLTMFLSSVLNVKRLGDAVELDWKGLIIFAVLCAGAVVYKIFRKKSLSPIILILFSAGLGLLMYGF